MLFAWAGCRGGLRTGVRCTTRGSSKIGRPRQIYTGYAERDYLAVDGRWLLLREQTQGPRRLGVSGTFVSRRNS